MFIQCVPTAMFIWCREESTFLSNSYPWIHCMKILFNISVTVFVISACQMVLEYCINISFRHRCCVERSLGCVVLCLCLDCRGQRRSHLSVNQTICMLLKSVPQTGLCGMLFSVVMSRQWGRLFFAIVWVFCVCMCVLYVSQAERCLQ